MSPLCRAALASCVLLPTITTFSPAAPTKEEIARAITELGDNNFGVREKASAFLRAAGKPAEPALLEAMASKDAEVSRRATAIMAEFKWGVYPDTPKNVLKLIADYRGGNAQAKVAAINELTKLGGAGFSALLRIAGAEDDARFKADLFSRMARETAQAVPVMLMEENHAIIEELLELSLPSKQDAALRNYAAYILLRGRLDERIPHYKARAQGSMGAPAAAVLTHLYRAKGDLPSACAAAEKSADEQLLRQVLTERGDWKELARRQTPARDATPDIETLAYLAACHRLAGQTSEFNATLEAMRKAAESETGHGVRQAAKAFFLNDCPSDGVALLLRKKQALPAFEVLCTQLRYRDAFEMLQKASTDEDNPAQALDLRRAYHLYQIGDRDQALQVLAKAAEALRAGGTSVQYRDLLRIEARIGLTEQAFELAARGMSSGWDDERAAQALTPIFPGQGEAAEVWWTFFRKKYAEEKELPVMRRVRDIFEKKISADDFVVLAEEVAKETENLKAPRVGQRTRWLLALVETSRLLGKDDLALKYVERAELLAESPRASVRWGDLLAEKNEWKQAAERYQKAWERDRTQPLPLYLRGWALLQAGDAAQGKKLMEIAHLLPLASDETRYAFAGELSERGHKDAARRERELLLRIGPDESWEMNEVRRQSAYDAMFRKDHARAADLFERFRLRCLRSTISFVDEGANVHMPVLVHLNRACALAAAGKPEDARKAAQRGLASTPGNVNLSIQVVAELDRRDCKADADEFFAALFTTYEKVCADYPNSATLHNSLAWLCAACRRKLDKGLEHARKATELAPKQAGYLDTFAELHFQNGNNAKAIELMKRCLELEPKHDYFRRQLKRLEAGDPKAALPDP
ncbi:MAG: hypothetical protein K2R98_26430 [Gemmataceae bacterium]|nr:hypothetical protein [Gemmataceae bacterium]